MTLGCLTITILSIVKNGTVSFERFDIVCQSLALTGLVLWWILGDPTIALVMAVVVDCIAALPTLRHAWKAPHEETLFNFLTAGIASVVTLCAIHSVSLVSVLYPLYLVIINLVTAGAIIFSGKRLTRSQRNEAERL
jgi:hypothetical protein